MKGRIFTLAILVLLLATSAMAEDVAFVRIDTQDVFERTEIADRGYVIDYVNLEEGWVWAEVPLVELDEVGKLGYRVEVLDVQEKFPPAYDDYHNYGEATALLQEWANTYADIAELFTIGQSIEGRELWGLKISDNPTVDETDEGGFFLCGQHHAREILTVESVLYTTQQILENYGVDDYVTYLVDNREIFVVPTVNPDGAEWDQSGASFKMWRKNRRVNDGSSFMGVDLNRNYGYMWGGAGSSGYPGSDTYHGTAAFSEPETAAVRDFLIAHSNINVLISLHTYARLILYPWGHQYPRITDQIGYQTHKHLAEYMAEFNGYNPQQASALYITTGDTTDWAYGELGIISYTFEMDPTQLNPMGFYPQASIIPEVVQKNYPAHLLALGLSRDPSLVLAADLWQLDAYQSGANIAIEWTPIIETAAAGWNVLRSTGGKAYTPINDTLITPGQDTYSFTDTNVTPGQVYSYKIEFVSNYDNNQEFGPVSVDLTGDDDDDDDDTADDDATDDDAIDDDDQSDTDDDDDDDGCGC